MSYFNKFDFIDNKDRRYYHTMVNYLDDVVGDVVAALKSQGMWDNLLFVTSSDNRGPVFECICFAGKDARKKDRGVYSPDWYGTFCGLAGVDMTDKRAAATNLPPVDSLGDISGETTTSP